MVGIKSEEKSSVCVHVQPHIMYKQPGKIWRGFIPRKNWRLTPGARELNIDFLCFHKLSVTVTVCERLHFNKEASFQIINKFLSHTKLVFVIAFLCQSKTAKMFDNHFVVSIHSQALQSPTSILLHACMPLVLPHC